MRILNKILIGLYFLVSMLILLIAATYPFTLFIYEEPQYLHYAIIYPIALVIMLTQNKVLNLADKIMGDK